MAAAIWFTRNVYSCLSAGAGSSSAKNENGSVAVSRLGAAVLSVGELP
jgi:hypothetical protein